MKRAARLGVMRAGGLVRLGGVTRSHTSHGHYLACPGQKGVGICLNVVASRPTAINIKHSMVCSEFIHQQAQVAILAPRLANQHVDVHRIFLRPFKGLRLRP